MKSGRNRKVYLQSLKLLNDSKFHTLVRWEVGVKIDWLLNDAPNNNFQQEPITHRLLLSTNCHFPHVQSLIAASNHFDFGVFFFSFLVCYAWVLTLSFSLSIARKYLIWTVWAVTRILCSYGTFIYLIVPFWYASVAYQATRSLVEPWFVFWRDVVEPKYPWRNQTSLICRPSVPKRYY